jgi:DNA modification methylase
MGSEETPEAFCESMVKVFSEVRRVLRDDGTLWLNMGDCYYNYRPGAGQSQRKQTISKTNQDNPTQCSRRGLKQEGLKEKDLVGMPWRLAFALQADGWYIRSDIIWSKPNPMPESVLDRPVNAHEHLFLMSKSQKYYYDNDAIREPYSESSYARYNSDFNESEPHGQMHHLLLAAAGLSRTRKGDPSGMYGRSQPNHIQVHTSPHSLRSWLSHVSWPGVGKIT